MIAALAALLAAAAPITPYVSGPIAAAVAAPDRADQAATDARRHPAELLAFAGVKPGDTVVDLIPGGGYFTRLFSKVVGPKGHVYAVWPNEYAAEAGPDASNSRRLAAMPGYGNISVLMQPAAAFTAPAPVDLVFTSQNYHDYPDKFMRRVDLADFNARVFRALKKGGVFLVIDHAAAAGSGLRDTDTLHRIDPAIVREQVTAAGFRYAGSSDVLGSTTDDPTKTVFDKAVRGHTDQFVYKFVKP